MRVRRTRRMQSRRIEDEGKEEEEKLTERIGEWGAKERRERGRRRRRM